MTNKLFNRQPMHRSFNNLMDELFTEFPVIFKDDANNNWKGFIPVNITEQENAYSIDVVAPGFEKSDFKINLDQQILTISADKKEEVKNENNKNVRSEYKFRSFKRSFTLDEKINAESIDAKYVNGVLTLTLPKREVVKPASKEISVQ